MFISRYEELCRTKYNKFERLHDQGHFVVNGQMGDVQCSPSDPVFYIYHNYIDYLWEVFRTDYQQTDLETEYPDSNIGGQKHDAGR